jgi:two-component system, response regulator PdtaR
MPEIMIVEDERILAADLEDRLEAMGYGVCARASSGEQAVILANEKQPDLILMDIQLEGGMDGIEAAAAINDSQDLPIVYLSAFADQQMLERAKITEPFGYLVKPIKPRELRSTIEMVLYKADMERKLKAANRELKEALAQVKKLSGLLPICANCKKIRDGQDYWHQVEEYITANSEAVFSHGICPDCMKKLYPEICKD